MASARQRQSYRRCQAPAGPHRSGHSRQPSLAVAGFRIPMVSGSSLVQGSVAQQTASTSIASRVRTATVGVGIQPGAASPCHALVSQSPGPAACRPEAARPGCRSGGPVWHAAQRRLICIADHASLRLTHRAPSVPQFFNTPCAASCAHTLVTGSRCPAGRPAVIAACPTAAVKKRTRMSQRMERADCPPSMPVEDLLPGLAGVLLVLGAAW